MKNKITRTLTAFCAALLLMGGFSVPAFAQTPEDTPDATDDSGVVVEEPQEAEPLTPEGNATLVDDFGGNKQLITVTTKAGNYFYILIDRDDEGGKYRPFPQSSRRRRPFRAFGGRGNHNRNACRLQLYGEMRSRSRQYKLPRMLC